MMLLDVGPVPVGRTTYSWDIKTGISTLVHASALIRSLIKTLSPETLLLSLAKIFSCQDVNLNTDRSHARKFIMAITKRLLAEINTLPQ